jgi:toxin FitB
MNIVDSCGWLAYLRDEANRPFFEPVLHNKNELIVPAITVYEVTRQLMSYYPEQFVTTVFKAMSVLRIEHLDASGMLSAAHAARQYKLHMADAIIWQTAQAHGAKLYTQDAALEGLPGVVYRAKQQL